MPFPSARSLALLSTGLLIAAPLRAGTIAVPSQQPTIQAGIDAAVDGDTVLVAPGHYFEHVDFVGKAVTVQSSSGSAATTIDGGGAGSVVSFTSGETSNAVLRGFTITGGAGTYGDDFGGLLGGGILVRDASPLLRNLVVTANSAQMGAGICAVGGSPQLLLCAIRGNDGTGVDLFLASAQLQSCTIEENNGLGVQAYTYSGDVSLTDCTVRANAGIGLYYTASQVSASLHVEGGEFDDGHGTVGGILVSLQSDVFFGPKALIHATRFRGNAGSSAGAVQALAAPGSGVKFEHCVFTANSAPGVPVAQASGSTFFTNCTFADNLGPVATVAGAALKLTSCIVRNNPGTLPSALIATWSDVQGGAAGTGNIDADPLFKDEGAGDFRLAGGSPCIDSGDPAAPADADGTRTDMGAIAFAPFTDVGLGLAGATGTPALSGTGTLIAGQPAVFTLAGAKPNAPFALIAGVSALFQPFKGGTLVPAPDILLTGLTDAGGNVVLAGSWPAGIPHGFITWLQFWITDAGGPKGYAASNGLAAEAR